VAVLLTGFATVELAVSAITEYGSYTCLRNEVFRRAEFRQIIRQALSVPPVAAPSSPAGRDAASTRQQGAPTVRHKKPAVLIVEDDAGWRSILAELVEETGRRPRLCSSYGEALGNLRKHKFALLTVDLSLASSVDEDNMDGYRILAQARAGGIPALVVSGMAHASDIERAFGEYGIAAYLEKQSFDRAAFRRAVEDAVASAAPAGGDLAALTGRERDVLNLLAQGLTNKDIAASLVISTNTVKRHLKAVFAKLGVNTRAAAAAKALTLRLDASPD
jgi:DNA-binding NarL/FixJ family response regulator